MPRLNLDLQKINEVKKLAKNIANEVQNYIKPYSSVSVERALLRLYGVDGVNSLGTPLPNVLIDLIKKKNLLSHGVTRLFSIALLQSGRDVITTAQLLSEEQIEFHETSSFSEEAIKNTEKELTRKALEILDKTRKKKKEKQKKYTLPPSPWKYLIVATGNIYEDRTQAHAAVMAGADIIAVIRSTAQSLLDYVPYGATTEGFGGTYATQENFRIMRKALDEAQEKYGRYIRLVNYSSGLCMAEIAACAAMEDLDMLLNDSMYGVLFRDINMKRTFIDQYFSRLLCSRAKIIINTGEDNYLTTSDAIEKAHTVTASQLINEALAFKALLTEDLMGLGHAFEIDPEKENSLLLELAHAQLARELFPKAPLKYMPPTKHKKTNVFFSHVMDSMFNLTSIATNQGIHLAGILTEAIHTPFMHDRYESLSSINYIFKGAKDLSNEIEFKKNGIIEKRANFVLDETQSFLREVNNIGLMRSIELGYFADIKRLLDAGKGLDGVFLKSPFYSNPLMEQIEKEGVIND